MLNFVFSYSPIIYLRFIANAKVILTQDPPANTDNLPVVCRSSQRPLNHKTSLRMPDHLITLGGSSEAAIAGQNQKNSWLGFQANKQCLSSHCTSTLGILPYL